MKLYWRIPPLLLILILGFALAGAGTPDPDDEHAFDDFFPSGLDNIYGSAPPWAGFIVYWDRRMIYAKNATLKDGVLTLTRLTYPFKGKPQFFRYRFLIPEDEAVGLIPIFANQVGLLDDLFGGGG